MCEICIRLDLQDQTFGCAAPLKILPDAAALSFPDIAFHVDHNCSHPNRRPVFIHQHVVPCLAGPTAPPAPAAAFHRLPTAESAVSEAAEWTGRAGSRKWLVPRRRVLLRPHGTVTL